MSNVRPIGLKILSGLSFLAVASIPLYNPSKVFSNVVTIPDVFIALFVVCTVCYSYNAFQNRFVLGRISSISLGILCITLISSGVNYALTDYPGDYKPLLRLCEGVLFAIALAEAVR